MESCRKVSMALNLRTEFYPKKKIKSIKKQKIGGKNLIKKNYKKQGLLAPLEQLIGRGFVLRKVAGMFSYSIFFRGYAPCIAELLYLLLENMHFEMLA